MNEKKTFLSKIIFNDKIMIIISIVLSFIIWIGMCMSAGEEFSKKISGIPITIELSEEAKNNGLVNYTYGNLSAEVFVTGNRLSVGAISADDIEIVASQAGTINAPGTYTLELSARKIGLNTDYEFSSTIYPSSVIVTIDRMREVSFPITNNLNYSIAEGYYEGATQFSAPEIKVSGPEKEVSRIDSVVVRGDIDEELTQTTTVSQDVVLLDMYGQVITNEQITLSHEFVDVTIPVDFKKTLKMNVDFKNVPSGFADFTDNVTLSQNEIEVAGPYDELKDIEKVTVASIDMRTVDVNTVSESLTVELPSTWKNISNISEITANFNMTGYTSKVFKVTRFDVSGCSDSSTAKVSTQSIDVKVIGLKSEIDSLSESDIIAVVDFGNKAKGYSGTAELSVNIDISGEFTSLWVQGEYLASVSIFSNE